MISVKSSQGKGKGTNLVKIVSTPFCSMLSSMAIEYGEETLTSDGIKVGDKRMRVLHGSPGTFIFGYTDLVCGISGRMTVQDLHPCEYDEVGFRWFGHTPWVSSSTVVIDFERALGESEKRGGMMDRVIMESVATMDVYICAVKL